MLQIGSHSPDSYSLKNGLALWIDSVVFLTFKQSKNLSNIWQYIAVAPALDEPRV